jgi:translation initiation factor 3 subunit A
MLRRLDEQAAKQRQREEEAEARRAAAKKAAPPPAERSFSRDQPVEAPPASGPPRIALAGNKPSWREREAMRASGQAPPAAASAAASPAASSAAPASEAEAPKPNRFIPPALRRGGADGDAAPPASRWREREGSGRGPSDRNESPATGGRYEAPGRGRFTDLGDKGRTQSPASGGAYVPLARRGVEGTRGREEEREQPSEALPPPSQGASDGKYRPGAFRKRPDA